MKYRKRLNKRTDRKFFRNTANRVHKKEIIIGQRGGTRI